MQKKSQNVIVFNPNDYRCNLRENGLGIAPRTGLSAPSGFFHNFLRVANFDKTLTLSKYLNLLGHVKFSKRFLVYKKCKLWGSGIPGRVLRGIGVVRKTTSSTNTVFLRKIIVSWVPVDRLFNMNLNRLPSRLDF